MSWQTWGRDDDTGGLSFKQSDIETVVDWTRKWCAGGQMVAEKSFDQSISSLCVSDTNKQLLLNCEDFIPLLVDSLLLDPEHPRRAQPDFDAVSPSIQRVSTRSLFVCLSVPAVRKMPAICTGFRGCHCAARDVSPRP